MSLSDGAGALAILAQIDCGPRALLFYTDQ